MTRIMDRKAEEPSSPLSSYRIPQEWSKDSSTSSTLTVPHLVSDGSSADTSVYNDTFGAKVSKWNSLTKKSRFNHLCKSWLFWTLIASTMIILIVALTTTLLLTHRAHAAAVDSGIVDLGYRKFSGNHLPCGVDEYLGIPYAAPPTGNLRFKAPQPPLNNTDVYPATQWGKSCIPSPYNGADSSEDCLVLNVWAPSPDGNKHPVYVFIQGGGFNSLSSPTQNGSDIVASKGSDHDIIVVTMNYRVGLWGFLAGKELQDGKGDFNVGNLDQRAALKWVQDHINKFGGDPTRVTLGGASAGAASVNLHLTAYGGRNDSLFHAAIGESNSFGQQLTIEESQYQYDNLTLATGCNTQSDTLSCLRGLSVQQLQQSDKALPTPSGAGGKPVFMYSNVIEGPGGFTQDYMYNNLAAGKFVKVPTIFGGDSNEGTIFTPKTMNTQDDVNNFLKDNWVKLNSTQLSTIDNLYSWPLQRNSTDLSFPSSFGKYWRVATNAYGEMRYNCPGVSLNTAFSSAGQNTWHYWWDVLTQTNSENGNGVTHTAEVSSVWGTSTGVEGDQIGMIQGFWTSFIRTGDPGQGWVKFTGDQMGKYHFATDSSRDGMVGLDPGQKGRCEYLRGIGGDIGM